MGKIIHFVKAAKLRQFALLFCIIIIMYVAIEVLPLTAGQKHLSFHDLLAQIRHRLPVILLIAAAASAYLTMKKPPRKKSGA
jgi:hypothetical protein